MRSSKFIFTIGKPPESMREAAPFIKPRPSLKNDYYLFCTHHNNPNDFENKLSGISMPYGLTGTVSHGEMLKILADNWQDWETEKGEHK